jgi:hypothetical protein
MMGVSEIGLRIDAVLRAGGWARLDARPVRSLVGLALIAVACALFYGGVMGTFTGLSEGKSLQILYSSLKVPILLLVTFAISLPSFFVVSTLLGLRNDWRDMMAALLGAQAGLSVTLASLAPLTAVWYLSCADYNPAILFNGVMFAIASGASQVLLRRHYRPLIARNARHRLMLRVWLITYIFVGIQMGWVLRPFIGSPLQPVSFFREGAWSNSYEFVARLIWNALRSG